MDVGEGCAGVAVVVERVHVEGWLADGAVPAGGEGGGCCGRDGGADCGEAEGAGGTGTRGARDGVGKGVLFLG